MARLDRKDLQRILRDVLAGKVPSHTLMSILVDQVIELYDRVDALRAKQPTKNRPKFGEWTEVDGEVVKVEEEAVVPERGEGTG